MDTSKTIDNRSTESLYRGWTDGGKYILAQSSTDIEFLEKAKAIGTPDELCVWIKTFPGRIGTFFVDAPEDIIRKMRGLRPELQIRNLPKVG